jgi:hypothetical protein
MRRGLVLSALDLVLVTLLLVLFGSSRWAWLGGPLSALAIWWTDCSLDRPLRQPSRSMATKTLETTASQG